MINNMYYIGRRSCLKIDNTYYGGGVEIKKAIREYGRSNFVREILEVNEDAYVNRVREEHIIGDLWKNDSLCYNKMPGGAGGSKTGPISDETKMKMSLAKRGKSLSEEHKLSLSKACKGINTAPLTKEHREKLSIAASGKTLSNETRQKMSIAAMKRWSR